MREAPPDRDLVAASIRGDVRAFGALVERHHGAVVAVGFAITRDLALSEDIAQETFVVAWTRLGDVIDPARVRAWLCNIARNRSKNELRRRTREGDEPDDNVADGAPSAADTMLAHESHAHVRAALAEVPDPYREPLVLFYWHEQSIESVASALSISEQAAQKRISRARKYVQEGLAARMEELGRGRRPAKAAAAAIVAVLATRAAPASAAAGATRAGAASSKGLFAVLAAVSAVLVVGVVAIERSESHDAAASPVATDTRASASGGQGAQRGATHAPAPAQLPAATTGSAAAVAKGTLTPPDAYELTELGPTSVAVNLAGGRSEMFLWDPPAAPAFARHVRGRVLDDAGKPVMGAIVLIGGDVRATWGSMTADAGATTDHAGAFDVVVRREEAASALAMHPRAGWSTPVAVSAGRGDTSIEIRIPRPGTIRGDVRRAGTPVEANVRITSGSLALDVDTDIRGHFEIPLLAPGAYHVAAWPKRLSRSGASKHVEQDVTVGSSRVQELTLDLAPGTRVVVALREPQQVGTVEYFLVPGTTTTLDASALRKLSRSGGALATLFGGVDVARPMQFHDVAPGAYTLCVDRRLDRDTPLPLVCQPVDVKGELVEVTVTPPPS